MQSLLSLIKFYYFPQTPAVSNVEILQMSRSIKFPLRFVLLDDHKVRYILNILGVISYCCYCYECL